MKISIAIIPAVLALCQMLPRAGAAPLTEPSLWTVVRPFDQDGTTVRINPSALTEIKWGIESEGAVNIFVDSAQDAILECRFSGFQGLFHPDLAAKYPNLVTLSGHCDDGLTTVTLCFNENDEKSVAVTIHYQNRKLLFADHDDDLSADPMMLHLRIPSIDHSTGWTDSVKEIPQVRSLLRANAVVEHADEAVGRRLKKDNAVARKFRLALICTAEFSALRGNTVEEVLTWIAKALTRINGIFLKEMGVMFELIAENEKLICLPGDDTCEHLRNDHAILEEAEAFMAVRNINAKDYDIGHSLTTRFGGVSYMRSLCADGWKQKGSSGYGMALNPGDEFYLVIAHEFAHSLGAPHTFRDCRGPGYDQLHLSGAVEPGSGTTIMSYPGECFNDVQKHVDPWFNSRALELMEWYFGSPQVQKCEMTERLSYPRPEMATLDYCTVPRGNYVQLSGNVANEGEIPTDIFFAWDRVDPGFFSFSDPNVARFAPREPTVGVMKRFLPNMYILSFGPNQMEEIEPQDGGGDQNMTFRFIGRTAFDPDATVNQTFSSDLAGAFGFKDMTLTFDDELEPLKITSFPAILQAGSSHLVTWTGASIDDEIEILVAFNTMVEVVDPDFNKVVDDLDFILLHATYNSGSAVIEVPELENPDGLLMNLMVRSGNAWCYFFDLAAGLEYQEKVVEPSLPPSPTPSLAPSVEPQLSDRVVFSSSQPSMAPTDPTVASCTESSNFVCGNELVDGAVVASRFAACLFDAKKETLSSKCLDQDELLEIESMGWLDQNLRFESCGCCPQDDEDFCGEPLACPIELYGGCTFKGKKNSGVGVEICYNDKKGNLKTTCKDPFHSLHDDEVLVGCGSECIPPEAEYVLI